MKCSQALNDPSYGTLLLCLLPLCKRKQDFFVVHTYRHLYASPTVRVPLRPTKSYFFYFCNILPILPFPINEIFLFLFPVPLIFFNKFVSQTSIFVCERQQKKKEAIIFWKMELMIQSYWKSYRPTYILFFKFKLSQPFPFRFLLFNLLFCHGLRNRYSFSPFLNSASVLIYCLSLHSEGPFIRCTTAFMTEFF
jgi:hypothetical protein